MSDSRELSSPPGPKRLSWGRTSSQRQSSSRPTTSSCHLLGGQQQQYAELKQADSCTAASCSAETQPRDQQPYQGQQLQAFCSQPGDQQSCKAVLREVLCAVLGESGPQLDHFQLTLPAVLAVLQHKLAEAASSGHSKASAAAAAAAKQQALAAQKEAEGKAAKQLQDAAEQAAAVSAQHSREVSGLQAQLSALQRQHKQLQGKCAQQARDLREATDSAQAARGQQQGLQVDLQELRKQLQGKAAALSRTTSVRQQQAAALKAELQQTAAAAEANAAQHQHNLQQLQDKHAAELARLEAQHGLHVQQQLQAAAAEHHQQTQQLSADLQAQLWRELAPVQEALLVLSCQQQEAAAWASSAQADCMQEASALRDSWQQQLQEVRSELAAVQADAQEVVRLAAEQQAALQELLQHQAKLAPQGLEALAQQAQEAAAARADHAAALQQLQDTCMQLATVQPTVQQLQQRQQRLEQEKADLQAQLAQAAAAASAHQQERQQQAATLLQQLEHVKALNTRLQQQLDTVLPDLTATKDEAAAATNKAAAAQQLLVQATADLQTQWRSMEAANSCGWQQLQERLQWLCSSYFVPDSGPPAASSSGACTHEPTAAQHAATGQEAAQPCPAAEASTGFGGVASRADAPSEGSKLQQLSRHLSGGGERLLFLFEQYKSHKQEMLQAAGSNCGGSCSPTHTTATGGRKPAEQPASEAVLQLQQQVLQLEACLLKFMLSLQEALDEAKHHWQRSACAGAGPGAELSAHISQQGGAQSQSVSPNRPERPSTAMSFTSSMTGISSRSSSLGSQLLAAMCREKQQLALELKKLHSVKRTPLSAAVAASGTSFPWQRAAGGSSQTTPRGAATGRPWLAAAAERSAVSLGHTSSHVRSGVTPLNEAGVEDAGEGSAYGLAGEGQQECWEEVDEVLQLLQGCQGLGVRSIPVASIHPPVQLAAAGGEGGCAVAGPTSGDGAASSPSKPGAATWQGQGQSAGTRQRGKLQWGKTGSSASKAVSDAASTAAAAAAATAGARSPARTLSWGGRTAQAASPGTSPILKKSASCGVQRGHSTILNTKDKGIGSLMGRR